ncbi:MAG: hypothetical protein ACKVP0_05065 [Pirellulaceae bacterium]
MLPWILGFVAVVAVLAGAYGLHRLCLYLEERGYMYYLHKKPQGSAAPMLLDMREIIQPSVRHVIELKDDQHIEYDHAGDDPKSARLKTDPSEDD